MADAFERKLQRELARDNVVHDRKKGPEANEDGQQEVHQVVGGEQATSAQGGERQAAIRSSRPGEGGGDKTTTRACIRK